MSTRDFFRARREAELPAFKRVLDALPKDKIDYRPHERSPSAKDLLWTLAKETKSCCALVDEGQIDFRPVSPPEDPAKIIESFDRSYRELDEKVAGLDDAAWNRPAKFLVEGKVAMEAPLGEFLWLLLFDAIHHRGQLSTYIRPMGGKVPSIYGPSGDDPGR